MRHQKSLLIASSLESHYHYPDGFTLDFREKVLGELIVFQEKDAEFEDATLVFGEYSNNERYHEFLNNLTPADVYFGRTEELLSRIESKAGDVTKTPQTELAAANQVQFYLNLA